MGIFEECLQPTRQEKGYKVDEVLSKLSKEDCQSLTNALNETSISAARIAKILQKRGFDVGEKSVMSWRDKNISGADK